MTEELKPCPFCGGEAIEAKLSNIYDDAYNVSCGYEFDSSCIGLSINQYYDSREDAIKAWNTRK